MLLQFSFVAVAVGAGVMGSSVLERVLWVCV